MLLKPSIFPVSILTDSFCCLFSPDGPVENGPTENGPNENGPVQGPSIEDEVQGSDDGKDKKEDPKLEVPVLSLVRCTFYQQTSIHI